MMGHGGIAALGMTTILHTMSATAQNMSYGANNFYRSNIVTIQPITFESQYQTTIAGNLFIRNNVNHSINLPAIVVSHPIGAVKEQNSNLYAIKLAEQGFVTVSLDLPFWGSSKGKPRNTVSPELYVEAFSAAVDYLGTNKLVGRERIGALGIYGSGSFVISAAKIDPRIKAIATSSSGKVQYTGGTPNELTSESTPVNRESYNFYHTRRGEFTPEGSSPELTTRPTLSSFTKFINFYPFNDIKTISPRPMLFIAGDQAHSREFSEDAYTRAAKPKEMFWVPGAGHIDLYDRVGLIPFHKLTQFFKNNLGKNRASLSAD
ncbi:Alpha/Beta hydrolase protein [Diaporthe sp. PMI_573]|nr:Alpha/Beta hydrolase protein [Diaporthaceae sp. PMI_573]